LKKSFSNTHISFSQFANIPLMSLLLELHSINIDILLPSLRDSNNLATIFLNFSGGCGLFKSSEVIIDFEDLLFNEAETKF
jgi:hypothetical protein